MAEFFLKKRRRAIVALSAVLTASFSLGLLAACGGNATTDETPAEDEPAATTATDTQLLKNGNFEFYSEREEARDDKRNFISTPTSWTFTSGSPSSDTRSGLIETEEWNYLSVSGRELTSVEDAYAHWNDEAVTLYDRLKFLDLTTKRESSGGFKETYDALAADSDEKKLFTEYSYSVDFEDVENLHADFPDGVALHDDAAEDETALLMIHNSRNSDGVRGTAQYYTSSTTITLEAGSAAVITGWVRTDHLHHYYSSYEDELTRRGGAYIGLVNTVGGTTLDEMQVKNINTKGEWQKYTLYVRASTYATTTVRLKLGLGQGTSSDNRYENVDGYAFFDDFSVKKIRASEYVQNESTFDAMCDIDSKKEGKTFDATEAYPYASYDTFALDLYKGEAYDSLVVNDDTVTADVTKEVSGRNTYESLVEDNRGGDTEPNRQSIVGVKTYDELKAMATPETNGYLATVFADDFDGKFPFYEEDGVTVKGDMPVIMLLSTNGAAYTAKMTSENFTVEAESRMLVSFFVKTFDIRAGKTGAAITLVDGDNRTAISAFNSHSVATVDIDKDNEELTDIYKGWVQCFFFVSNETDTAKEFRLEFTFGPTSVATSKVADYAQGYAAFTNFTFAELNKKQYSYASTGNYAKKVTLSGELKNSSKFDDPQASSDISKGLATPASFKGMLAGSKALVPDEDAPENKLPDGVFAGLLNYDYRSDYVEEHGGDAWMARLTEIAGSTDDWWMKAFGDKGNSALGSQQPLVYLNTTGETAPSYGFISSDTSVSAGSSRRIGMRVKAGVGTTVYVYLIDKSDASELNTVLAPNLPNVTYWYDDNGNIVKSDPTAKGFNKKTDTLFYLEDNGLYTRAGATGDPVYYANLHNYKTDADGNFLSEDETMLFYRNPADGKIYAYRNDENADNVTYSVEVNPLPIEVDGVSIVRYTAPSDLSAYRSVITVTGTEENKDRWTDISFYLRAGSESKDYCVEIWIGERGKTDGVAAGAYAFIDSYRSNDTVTDYDGQRETEAEHLLETEANRAEGDEEKLNGSLALYYTFTFYDSTTYERYDSTTDDSGIDPWGNYKQSAYEEGLVWLRSDDEDGILTGTPSKSLWIDYSATDVTVEADTLDDNTTEQQPATDEESGEVNIWLILSSAALAIVLIFAIVAVALRAVGKRVKKTAKVKPAKKDKRRKAQKRKAPEETEEPETPEEPNDDPYNE